MKRNQMSTHSKEAFDESDAVDIVKRTLQSKRTIRAFFGENDKTPNHDGFFELINAEGTPYKKFVVQIKKTKPLRKKTKGENKGKYVYQLKTNFLDYIKYKVTESPAIYFVVDVENKIIFWLYLSDEVLMNLDYDGKPKVPYAFSEENILFDVSKFTSVLNHIVQERNKAFLNKTESEISEMQDALDYINHHLDFDFKVIKDTVFPNLWRFGIRCSDNPEISIGFGQGKERIPVSSAVALYPQMKGKNDSGIQEYVTDYENLFNKFSLGKKEDLAIYSQNTLHEIIKLFFESGIPPHYLPDLVLSELIDVFVKKSNSLWEAEIKLSLDEVTRRYAVLMQYIRNPPFIIFMV